MRLFIYSFFLTLSVFSQNTNDSINEIKEIIITENRFSTAVSKKNRNVIVIDHKAIAKLPARNLQDVLQYVNGVDIRQRGPFGTQADVSIDGGSFEQTVVLLNGTKIVDAQTAHNMLNLPIPLEAIERIEVVRGPAAMSYGTNSLTGAINIITKRPMNAGVFINTYLGSNFEKNDKNHQYIGKGMQVGAAVSNKTNQHTLFLSHDKSNGYRYNTEFENNKIFYENSFQINDSNEIKSSFGYVKNNFGANGFYASPSDVNADEIVQTTLASIQSRHELNDRLKIMPRVSYRYNYDDYRYFGSVDLSKGRTQHYSNSFSTEINATYKLGIAELGFGFEARNEAINSSSILKHQRDNLGIYLQYRTQITPSVDVNVGTYVNYNSSFKWQIYPAFDASYTLNNNIKFIANVGSSQRIPSFTDLYLYQLPGNLGNPTLTAEESLQAEIGIKFSQNNFSLEAYCFDRSIRHFIDWTKMLLTDPWISNNIGKLHTTGINVKLSYSKEFDNKNVLKAFIGYSNLNSNVIQQLPATYSKYTLSSLNNQITNTIEYRFAKSSITLASRYNDTALGKSYWINDVRLNKVVKKFTVYIDAQNIFNSSYNEVGAIPMPGRWLALGLKYSSI